MNRKRRIGLAGAGVIVVATILWAVLGRNNEAGIVSASGTVEATEADLGFQMAGRIERIAVREGDRVQQGQELAWLDRSELLARHQAAQAQADAARAMLAEMERGFRTEEIEQGRAALRAAEQRLVNARREFERATRLHEGGAVSQQSLDNQQTALELAQSDYDSAAERLRILETGPRPERIAAQRAAVAQAEAGLHQIDAVLKHATIAAPFDGIISVRHREPGEAVGAGAPVLTVRDVSDRWVRIFIREDQVGLISIGQEADITADAYPDRHYSGRVVFLASEAEFTPRNVQTTEERVKLVYRAKVQITGDDALDLKPGLAADVRIEIAEQ